ncbi:hypothetical protein CC78DRAFT_357046 [Lojkania enalia]|uniref:DUF7165 domain-containing protein n=1 Tax=Lojkania enalia TaxID=147567 RepID=A0A9P4N743_9PLEO|nr:hypothetical protein CC78DRAFT_357046 [Didymosphaeria enalia]
MVGRRRTRHDDPGNNLLAIKTDVSRGKGRVGSEHDDAQRRNEERLSRTGSVTSLATSADHDESHNTHLSASSTQTGRTDTLSSTSAHSTARTSTSAMIEDDSPGASSPPIPSKHAHPTVTVLELISNTASSSALPDSFGFNVSRKGAFVAVYTASNIWLIQATQLPRLWARTLEVKRKPVAIDIQENGFLLAVLSKPSQVDLYEIHGERGRQIKKRRTVMLVHEAHALAISPDGLVLITGNRFGIEVVSIAPDAPESCRRTLSGPVGDTLEFSDDGRTLLITGYARKLGTSSLYVLPGLYDGPLNEEGVPVPASPEAVWTGLVLFPETAKVARQATLLPDADTGQVNELFAFNADEDTWGVYDIAAQRFTQTKMFLPDQQRWTRSEFIDDAMPAVSPKADLAAVALRMRGTTSIWIYQVPDWDYNPNLQKPADRSLIRPCFKIPILNESADTSQEICALRWVKIGDNVQRLLAIGNINVNETDSTGPSVPQGSKGVMIVLDFDGSQHPGGAPPLSTKTEYDLDILLPGEKLPEGAIDFEREVELVRTRTMAQRRAQNSASNARRSSRIIPTPNRANTTATRERPASIRPPVPSVIRDDEELTSEEVQAAFEAPYDNTQPRSQSSLARAATVAALSPANRRHLRALPFRPLEYRRADGLREFPHESDADNWVPPPPAYTATAEASQSISLSHPNAPPTQVATNRQSSSIPPVPPLPANMNPSQLSTNPYPLHSSHQSQSSTDLSQARFVSPTPERRPSLLHPSTYPSPHAPGSGRRRSSATQPNVHVVNPADQSAYNATTANHVTRRPTMRSRRAVESTVDLRPPPIIDSATGRRGSAPDARNGRRAHNTPNILNGAQNPPEQSTRSGFRRAMLPRLTVGGNPPDRSMPLSAPPRTFSSQMRPQPPPPQPQMRAETRATMRDKDRSSGKKPLCAVM